MGPPRRSEGQAAGGGDSSAAAQMGVRRLPGGPLLPLLEMGLGLTVQTLACQGWGHGKGHFCPRCRNAQTAGCRCSMLPGRAGRRPDPPEGRTALAEAASHALVPRGLEAGDKIPLGGLWPRPGRGARPAEPWPTWAWVRRSGGGRFPSVLWRLGQEAGPGDSWWPWWPSVAASVGRQRTTTSFPPGNCLDGLSPCWSSRPSGVVAFTLV